MNMIRLSICVLTLSIASMLAPACGRKAVVVHDGHGNLTPAGNTRRFDEVQVDADRRAELQAEVSRRQVAYAVKIGGEKFAPGAGKAREGFKEAANSGRDPGRR
jgi:hypothetical protein